MKIEKLFTPLEIKKDVSIYEKLIGFSFPEKFRLFCETYELGSYFRLSEFFHPLYERNYYMERVYFKSLEKIPISLIKFDSLEDIFFNWRQIQEEDDWKIYKFLRISPIDIGGGIYIGFDGNFKDKVILIIWDSNDKFRVIANDLYELLEKSEIVKSEDFLHGYKYNQLFKLKGEDFWRIRVI